MKKGEPVDRALKRLKTKLDSEGILEEMRRRRAFETPTERKQRKLRTASKRKPATPASRNQNAPQRIHEFSEDEHTSLTDISLDVSTKSDQDRVVPPQTTQSGRKPTAPPPPPDVPMPTLKPVDLGEPQEVGLEAVL